MSGGNRSDGDGDGDSDNTPGVGRRTGPAGGDDDDDDGAARSRSRRPGGGRRADSDDDDDDDDDNDFDDDAHFDAPPPPPMSAGARRVAVLELQSSIAFGAGSALLVLASPLVRAAASCLLVLHAVPEMCVDGGSAAMPPRTAPHGRYLATSCHRRRRAGAGGGDGVGSDCRRRWNLAQSLVVAAASLVQGLAYGFLLQFEDRQGWALDAYLALILASASLWTASGLLVLAAFAAARRDERKCCGGRKQEDDDNGCGLGLLAGNVLYLLGCACWLPAAVNQRRDYNEAYLGGFLQQLAAGLWAAAALLFAASDGMRLCGYDVGQAARRKQRHRGRNGEPEEGSARRRREQGREETSSSSGDDGA